MSDMNGGDEYTRKLEQELVEVKDSLKIVEAAYLSLQSERDTLACYVYPCTPDEFFEAIQE